MSVIIEICAGGANDCQIAEQAGAHRVELNSALALGGLTPSYGTIKLAKELCNLPIILMIRPREGGFCYNDQEFATMKTDIKMGIELGVAGFAFGILTQNGELDITRTRELIKLTGEHENVLHRAFDVMKDPFDSLDTIINLGFKRILTSGCALTAKQGKEKLKRLLELANGKIEIIAASGIDQHNAKELIEYCQLNQIHGSFSSDALDQSTLQNPIINFSAPNKKAEYFTQTDRAKISALINNLK